MMSDPSCQAAMADPRLRKHAVMPRRAKARNCRYRAVDVQPGRTTPKAALMLERRYRRGRGLSAERPGGRTGTGKWSAQLMILPKVRGPSLRDDSPRRDPH